MNRLRLYLLEIQTEKLQIQCCSVWGLLQNTTGAGAGRGSNQETHLAAHW